MIVRTPPPKRHRPETLASLAGGGGGDDASPAGSDRRLVLVEEPPPSVDRPSSSDHMLCTYQCRQMVKSEFFEALSSAEKEAKEYRSKFKELSERLEKTELERKNFREQLLYVEQELAASRGREAALHEQLLNEVREYQERLKRQIQSNSEIEIKLQNEVNSRQKAESLVASAEDKANLLEGKLNRLSEGAEREKKGLHSELVLLKRELKLSTSRMNAEVEKMECRAVNAENEAKLLQKQLEDSRKHLKECLQQKCEAEKKLSALTVGESSSSDLSILVKHLQEELRNYESDVRKARKLKASYEQVELLKEKLLEERAGRERAEMESSKFLGLQNKVKELEDELSSWKLLMEEIPGISCPDDIPSKFAVLQKEVLESEMKVGEANARLEQVKVALESTELSKKELERQASLAEDRAGEVMTEVKRINSALSRMTEERDRLRDLVSELKTSESGEIKSDVISELESSLAKKDCYISELEKELYDQKKVRDRQRDEIKLLNERLSNEERKIRSLERESDRLRAEISLLESKLGHGDFSAVSTKVLRMVNTLGVDQEAKQTIEALQTELQKTRDKLLAVEELNNQPGEAGKPVDAHISEKILHLKEKVATLEKREERYKTVFADKISVFRRACCEIFGYKINMNEHQRPNGIPVTQFTLHSIYALHDDEKLEFEYESGNVTILPNGYTSQPEISRQIGMFVHKLNSIPALTANITVESFNRRTLS
ncbi:hypothetical protein MLD38_026875 [Melastoma candidum]|uniref:Uncharacterized protein n=1 Tax=Melastoma candidum TaxID=119954 RepID=A0ACB9P2W7_9MYRT|nr:hypothetical protein MLD38_026875 [Melastoma candidum]